MNVHPTMEVDYRQAEKTLKLWLKSKGMGIESCREWARWHYNNRPFWSVWGIVYESANKVFTDFYGIHIYDDGEVVIVAKGKWSDEDFSSSER